MLTGRLWPQLTVEQLRRIHLKAEAPEQRRVKPAGVVAPCFPLSTVRANSQLRGRPIGSVLGL